MRISIFGLGYVGCVSAGCLSGKGHEVIGVDVQQNKVDLINQGRPTIIEKDIGELIESGREKRLLSATTNVELAIINSEVSIIAVGTPSAENGHLDLQYIYKVAQEIGKALRHKKDFHVVSIRSTVLPGTNQKVGQIIQRASGKKRNVHFSVVSNPEFLREGSAVHDFYHPPLTLLGTDNDTARKKMLEVYESIPGEKVITDIEVAEIMKYVNNTFHALKVTFGNEVGSICKRLNIDSHKVMKIFCMDRQLNISSYYLKPGFSYGGSCLPKDTRALKTLANDLYINVPVINSIENSNEMHKLNALNAILSKGERKIGIMGISFKAGTDDLRNSPIVDIVERLIGKGYNVMIYDKNVRLSDLTGTNKDYIETKIPHLKHLITDNMNEVITNSEIIVIANREKEFEDILTRFPNKIILDLVRMWDEVSYQGHYEGIAWGDINSNSKEKKNERETA